MIPMFRVPIQSPSTLSVSNLCLYIRSLCNRKNQRNLFLHIADKHHTYSLVFFLKDSFCFPCRYDFSWKPFCSPSLLNREAVLSQFFLHLRGWYVYVCVLLFLDKTND